MSNPTRDQQIKALEKDWAENPRWKGATRNYSAADVVQAARLAADRTHDRPPRCREAVEPGQHRAVREHARRAHRQPGAATGQGRAEGDLPERLAGCRRREHGRRDVPGPVAVSGEFGAERRQAHQQHLPARRPDPVVRGQGRHRLLRADRCRRRGRLRRRAECLRTDEGNDRSGRRWRALRGPARVGEEVRPHGRQGAGAHTRSRCEADCGAPGCRRDGCADIGHRAHRCGSRRPGHQRRRRPATSRS